jgi:hypothetical protein
MHMKSQPFDSLGLLPKGLGPVREFIRFKDATIGIVGDYKVVVPKMLEKFKSKLNK